MAEQPERDGDPAAGEYRTRALLLIPASSSPINGQVKEDSISAELIADTIVRQEDLTMQRSAVISKCERYRYVLEREWESNLPGVLFVALNPSTADGTKDDPTVRRCIGFAQSWGFGKLIIANLFALRSTHPSMLSTARDPVGPRNDWWLTELSSQFTLTIAAWGIHGSLNERAAEVLPKLSNVHHLGLTNAGQPRHPLYLPKSVRPTPLYYDGNF